jgi:hypothetical protein
MGISMLGGIFSSLGLEEVGETITKIGNGVTLLGTAILTLGPIATSLVEKLIRGGWSV